MQDRFASFTKNRRGDKIIKIEFPFDLDLLEKVRSIPGRKWHKELDCWSAPLFTSTLYSLISWGFTLDILLDQFLADANLHTDKIVGDSRSKLYPFQSEGVAFLEKTKGRALIADEMGLGKTIQALAWLEMHPDLRPAIIIVPASLKYNWGREASKWLTSPDIEILQGTTPWSITGNIIIINYDILFNWIEQIRQTFPKVIITDECFPSGTKIMTPSGEKNIEDCKKGDLVLNALGIGVIEQIGKRTTTTLIRLYLSNHTTIDVTPNHLFFTKNGWTPAYLLKNEIIFDYSIIFNTFAPVISIKQNGKSRDEEDLRVVWERISNELSTSIQQCKILWKILLSEMEEYSSQNKEKFTIRKKEKETIVKYGRSSQKKSAVGRKFFQEDDNQQPLFSPRGNAKNKESLEQVWAPFTKTTTKRRQWKKNTTSTADTLGSFRRKVESRIPNQNTPTTRFRVPPLLQSRHSFTRMQSMVGSGWLDTSAGQRKENRREKRTVTERIRVERIEVLKSRSGGQSSKCDVYNLQVSGHPSYFAGGLLVHNCHYYKSNSAKRTKAVKKVARKVPHFIALSGTPIVNRPVEAFNALHIINPELFPDYWRYVHRYCAARNNGFGLDVSGASHKEELHSILDKTIMLRRLKKDVLKELPAKIRSFVPLEFVSKEYKIAEDNFIQYVKDTKGEAAAERAVAGEAFTRIAELKQLAVRGKLKAAIAWIADFLEIEDKLVVFATHKFVIDALMKEFGKVAVKVDGSVTQAERQRSVDSFQANSKVKLFVGNIKAAGVGITLTASSSVAFLELPWSPGELEQAEDRCHRIGQKSSVNIYYLLARDTIEEQIAKQIDQKRKVLGQVLDGEEVETESLLINLIHSYRK